MAECLTEIGKTIITKCLGPLIMPHVDYWWCFDNNIQVLKDEFGKLEKMKQKIDEAALRTDILRPGVEEWWNTATKKLDEAKGILPDDINPKAWNLISRYSIGKRANKAAEEIAKHLADGNFDVVADPSPIHVLKDRVVDLKSKIYDMKQKIEGARLRTYILRPGVEEWLNAATEKLEEAKAILEDDINPNSQNTIGERAKKASEEITKLLNDGKKFNVVADPAPPPSMGSTPHGSSMDFVSRKRIEEDIIKSLMKSSVSMIGICGMGGVGKTTMAERIKDRVMEEKLFEEAVMVVVSQEINKDKIQEEIAELFGLDFNGKKTMRAKADLLNKRLMDAKRKLIIFDDVWKSFKLEDLGVPFGRVFEKCKILLTTRDKGVCEKMKAQEIIPIEILAEDEAWNLFKEKAGDHVEDSDLRDVAKKVVAECKGLPIALVTVGMALQNQGIRTWRDSLSQLRQANPDDFPDVLEGVYKPLKLSYDKLDNKHKQLLFLLCCLFPEDYNIPMKELTLYFTGLQICENITSIEKGRDRVHNLVENLKSRFLLIDGKDDFHVKMHDVVRDVAIYIGSKEKDYMVKSMSKISIENSSDINCNWMSMVDDSYKPMKVDMGLRFPKLRLLMLKLKHLRSDISLEGIRDLNVLSLSNISIGSLPPTLAFLENLRTLYLDDCSVENIYIIGKLAALEILYCHKCYKIKELPAEIGILNRLRLLELNECHELQRIPFGILSSLVQLEELKMFRSFDEWEADENGKEMRNASAREFESLPNLTCLEIEISDSNLAAQEICLSPKLLKRLKYKIFIAGDGQLKSSSYESSVSNFFTFRYRWDEQRDECEKAMNLILPSGIGAVGKWIQILVKNTEYLRLEGDGSNNFNLEECQDLRILEVWKCSTLKKLVRTKDCKSGIVFPLLERLELIELENIEEIWDGTIILNQNFFKRQRSNKYCEFHKERGHATEGCRSLREEVECFIKEGF